MVTEEIRLNERLEGGGLEVTETDFGEYIVQLAGDRPSHIILPIIHMTRGDVGRLFERRLRVPYTDDPGALARIARATLREHFLRADMGTTGANFGVAEEGAICLVSNEGNIRMVTTLPRIHVAILGIEKIGGHAYGDTYPGPMGAVLTPALRGILRRRTGDGWTRQGPGPLGAWTEARDLHPPARKTFQEWWMTREGSGPRPRPGELIVVIGP
jgi:L-lactate utilization protein LutB